MFLLETPLHHKIYTQQHPKKVPNHFELDQEEPLKYQSKIQCPVEQLQFQTNVQLLEAQDQLSIFQEGGRLINSLPVILVIVCKNIIIQIVQKSRAISIISRNRSLGVLWMEERAF